jgi:hypothetical protein
MPSGPGPMSNPYFTEILSVLNAHEVEYLLVGGYAVAWHGRLRATEDLDLWVRTDPVNLERLQRALEEYFGTPLTAEQAKQLRDPSFMVSFGRPPSAIDLHMSQLSADFGQAWSKREPAEFMDVPLFVIDRRTLAAIKKDSATKRIHGSPKFHTDLADVAWLEGHDERNGA